MNPKSVRIWIMILGLWSGVQVLTPAHAYEGDHYVWTYYLARHVGYTHRQAFQLASATYAIDFDPNTGPMPEGADIARIISGHSPAEFQRKWTKFHAFASSKIEKMKGDVTKAIKENGEALLESGMQQKNPGPYLHFIQDIYAHAGFNDFRGHLLAGHVPDYISYKPQRAKSMTDETLAALIRIRSTLFNKGTSPLDQARIANVLAALVKADPYPPGYDTDYSPDKPNLMVGNALWLANTSPGFKNSYPVILRSLQEDYQAGRLEKFPHRSFLDRDPLLIQQVHSSADVAPVLPEKWKQYAFDRDGRGVEDGSYALENLQLHVEEPTVRVEIPTPELLGEEEHRALVPQWGNPERKARRITIKVAYRLTGVVPSLGSLPIVERMELGEPKLGPDFQSIHGKVSTVRYVDQNTYDGTMELVAFVNTESCEQNLVVLTTGLQVAGLEPVWRRHKLVTTALSASVQGNLVKPGAAVWKLKDGWPKPNEHLDWHHKNTRNRIGGGKITFLPTEAVVLQWSYTEPPEQLVVGQTYRLSLQGLSTTHPGPPHPVSHVGIGADAKVMTSPLDGRGIYRERNMSHGVIPPPLRPDYGNNPTADSIDFVFQPDSFSKSFRVWVALPVAGIPLLIYEYEPFKPAATAGGDPKPPPSNATGYKLQRLPDPVFAASAPKTAVAPVPPSVAVAPKEIPPPNKSVSDLLAQTFGTHSGIRAGKLVLIEVERGSPGDNMGLGSGDRILRIGDNNLDGLMAAELQSLAHAPLRAPLEIELLRGRDQARVVVTLIERAPAGYAMTVTVVPGPAQ